MKVYCEVGDWKEERILEIEKDIMVHFQPLSDSIRVLVGLGIMVDLSPEEILRKVDALVNFRKEKVDQLKATKRKIIHY